MMSRRSGARVSLNSGAQLRTREARDSGCASREALRNEGDKQQRQTRRTPMKLTNEQLDFFEREGWLFLPELFSPEETAFLAREAERIYDTNRPEVWREKSGAPRTAFAAHLYNEAFGVLAAHPRMIEQIEQIFREKISTHQLKNNPKPSFPGAV